LLQFIVRYWQSMQTNFRQHWDANEVDSTFAARFGRAAEKRVSSPDAIGNNTLLVVPQIHRRANVVPTKMRMLEFVITINSARRLRRGRRHRHLTRADTQRKKLFQASRKIAAARIFNERTDT
jgi:hypothetical protein